MRAKTKKGISAKMDTLIYEGHLIQMEDRSNNEPRGMPSPRIYVRKFTGIDRSNSQLMWSCLIQPNESGMQAIGRAMNVIDGMLEEEDWRGAMAD